MRRREVSMKWTRVLATSLVLCALTPSGSFAQTYDLVINNGRVMDPETLYDDVANVGIKDGRIVAITKKPITGDQTIDAKGRVVAPGSIDTHFHWQAPLGYAIGLRDGLTTPWISNSAVQGRSSQNGTRRAPVSPRPIMAVRPATSRPARW